MRRLFSRDFLFSLSPRYVFFVDVQVSRGAAHALRVAMAFTGDPGVLFDHVVFASIRRFFFSCHPAASFASLRSLLSPATSPFFFLCSPSLSASSQRRPAVGAVEDRKVCAEAFAPPSLVAIPSPPVFYVSTGLMTPRLQGLARLLQLWQEQSREKSPGSQLFDPSLATHLLSWFETSHRQAGEALRHAGIKSRGQYQDKQKKGKKSPDGDGGHVGGGRAEGMGTPGGAGGGGRGGTTRGGRAHGENAAVEYFRVCVRARSRRNVAVCTRLFLPIANCRQFRVRSRYSEGSDLVNVSIYLFPLERLTKRALVLPVCVARVLGATVMG